ncbi:MAG: hypothetical protein RML40_06655 [Bacteroidota bacterium]|nr:hypothetical protein [Candidatus Kapabacteria bacterium]MDW8220196.1 hypothetical protein [Bacteroidota bacterium]
MAHAHTEDLHPNPLMTTIGVVAAFAAAWFITLILSSTLHAPRFATGIVLAIVGILTGAFSNSAGLFPNLQRFMETFGVTLFSFSIIRFLHLADALSTAEGFWGTVGKILMLFM